MSTPVLQTIWFLLIAILYIGFFFLEGFDFGVGMLLPFLGRNDKERRAVINAIGPHWDGNEVWLLTAGGATFAAFPVWYATLFSGFYLAFFLLLLALIVRGVAFEFRSKSANPAWRNTWDWALFGGSLVASLLLGVAFANLAQGLPIDATHSFTGNLFTLLNPYGLLGGIATVIGFMLYGATFLNLKLSDELAERARRWARRLWPAVVLLLIVLLVATYFATDLLERLGINPGVVPITSIAALLAVRTLIDHRRDGWAFAMTGLHIALTLATCFMILFPRLMISTTNPDYSLTIYNASSSAYTLGVMTIVALIFVPIILAYQGWTYWVFRQRLKADPKTLTY